MTNTTSIKVPSLYPRASFVGFDHLFAELDFVARNAKDTYPPHNVVKINEFDYVIEVAVAGFEMDDLILEQDERTLNITGNQQSVDASVEYLHKGISAKKFHRTFRLSEYVEVVGATLDKGILVVNLKVELPIEKRPRKIKIN
jgi:molecular chaperone IbpA